jgi:putative oxidoreductase
MPAFKRIVIPPGSSLGLLILRVGVGLSLFLKHGLEKIEHLSRMAAHFPDPLHLGSHPTFLVSFLSDAVCSVLVTLGLFTRWAALVIFINIFAAWSLVHRFQFFGHGADHGELVVLYSVAFLAILCAGAGRYSLDHLIMRSSQASPSREARPARVTLPTSKRGDLGQIEEA